MSGWHLAWLAFLALAVVHWARVLSAVLRLRGLPRLGALEPRQPEPWPRLSVVVPARNQVDTLEAAAGSLLAQDLPGLELVLVDDRSDDGTGALVDRLAAADPRVVAGHVTELPAGWLGKVHAMQAGLQRASGELLLFTDADVHFAPGALRRAVAHLEEARLDQLAAVPRLEPAGLVADVMATGILRTILTLLLPPWRAAEERSPGFFGVGAFNLVRRAALERTEGLGWLRMETADDMGLGLLLKRSGARCAVVTAFDEVGLQWYRSVAELASGMEKSWAVVGHCSLLRSLALGLPGLAAEVAPLAGLAALALGPGTLGRVLGAGLAVLSALALTSYARWSRGSWLTSLLGPLATPLVVAVGARSAALGLLRGGIAWRGTVYPCEELRRGMRVRV